MGHGHVTPNPDGSKARCGGPGVCPTCNQEAATAGFHSGGTDGPGAQPQTVTCPNCRTTFQAAIAVVGEEGPVRMTEAAGSGDGKKPFGDVEYADPGYQKDGKKRYPLDTEAHVRAAWSYVNQSKNAAAYSAADLAKVKAKIKAAAKKLKISISEDAQEAVRQAVEAMVNGTLSFSDIAERVQGALRRRLAAEQDTGAYCWVSVVDLSVSDVVYAPHVSGMRYEDDYGIAQLWECSYTITADGEVSLGDAHKVVRSYSPAPGGDGGEGGEGADSETGAAESREPVEARAQDLAGRVLEALDDDEDGGRVFRMRILAYGESRNRRRYTESVMSAAAHLYEGAAAYDHHRTEEEMRSSTTAGLIGYYRNVEAETDGIYGDLHLLPSATRAAEALDATLALQGAGLSPLLGVSHDVMGHYRPVTVGGRRLQEATAIARVNSVDLVADPAAGGQATRMVAGGTDDNAGGGAGTNNGTGTQPAGTEEDDVPPSKQDILGALAEATDEELAGVGLARARTTEGGTGAGGQGAGEGTAQNGQTGTSGAGQGGGQNGGEGQGAEHVLEASAISAPKTSWLAASMIAAKVKAAGLPEAVVESLTADLPDRVTEADVDNRIAGLKSVMAITERAGLAPTTAATQVTQEAQEKKVKALDAFFEGRFNEGYYSFRQAFTDFTGLAPKTWDEDFNRTILRESFGSGFDGRTTESLVSTSWAQVLGDSVTRRLVAMYQLPALQTWRMIVSSIVPVNDFRTQRISRVGGYGVLPTVGEGQPYQPLTSPPDEEATYAITKKGGTEDLTLEMIANDDVRAISNIPTKLGRAAAQTLYRFVWDLLRTNAVCTYDSTALFHANHGNTANPGVLSESTLSAARVAMAKQVAYGDDKEILSLTPAFLVIPAALETLAFKLTTSAVAVTAGEDATTPNIHQGTKPIKVDYFGDDNDWFLVADPAQVPTIEIGFYQGRQDPELFTQSDPNVGSMFNADKYTYKIRHPYSGTVLDHRGFYRGNND